MPKLTFSNDNVKKSGTDFPRVKLDQGATWRIVIIESEPTYAWTHRMVKPKFSPVSGRMMMKKITRRSGEEIEVADLDFVGSPVCHGSVDILNDKGVDPDHCPICREYQSNPEQFSAPERRFAVHVLKYATKPGGAQLAPGPFNVETRVWVMSENRFAKVTGIISEWGGDPRGVDLVLGPCSNAGFQNYEIAAAQKCEWTADDERKARAIETFKGNNAGDLEPYCGRVTELRWINNDIDDIKAAWRRALGGASGGDTSPPPVDVSGTLDTSLLDSVGSKKATEPPTADLSQLDDTVGGVSDTGEGLDIFAPDPPKEEVKAPAARTAAPAGELDFDSLLDNI